MIMASENFSNFFPLKFLLRTLIFIFGLLLLFSLSHCLKDSYFFFLAIQSVTRYKLHPKEYSVKYIQMTYMMMMMICFASHTHTKCLTFKDVIARSNWRFIKMARCQNYCRRRRQRHWNENAHDNFCVYELKRKFQCLSFFFTLL